MKLRKLMIVIEETEESPGKSFNVYLDGDKERIGTVQESEMSAAEFWGSKLFISCCAIMSQTGVVKTVKKRGKDD